MIDACKDIYKIQMNKEILWTHVKRESHNISTLARRETKHKRKKRQ